MLKKCFFLYTHSTNLACINSYFEVYLALQCLHLQNSEIKSQCHAMTPYTKKKLKETKSSFLKDHSKNMIMDGTCHIVEDNMAKDKIFFCHKSIQI